MVCWFTHCIDYSHGFAAFCGCHLNISTSFCIYFFVVYLPLHLGFVVLIEVVVIRQ